jgi:hypothetical protein
LWVARLLECLALIVQPAYPAVLLSAPLLALTCTLTLKLGLDAGLKNIFTFEERPPSPPAKTPLRTNKNRLSGSAFPRTTPPAGYPRAATPPAGIYSRSQNRSSSPALRPADKFDPEKEERRTKGAAARRKRSQQEEYAFAGFEDVNLLDSAGQALDLPEDIGHFPSSRLHPAVTSASIGVTSTSRGLDPQFGHARRHSRAQSAGNAAEAWPTLRRSHRKTLKVHSAIHLRIRPLETPISLPQDRQDFDDEFVSQIGTTLSVEVENNRHTGMGFEIDAIWVEVHMATASSTPKRLPFLFPGQKAAVTRLQRNDQHDFLFALKAADVLEEDATAAGSEQPHTPISAVSNLRQILSGPLQQRAVAQGNEDSRFPPEQPQQNRTMAMHRTVCVVVRGRPVYLAGANAMDQALPNALHVPVTHPRPGAAALPTYFTAAFDSRWNCSLDLTSLATRREEKRSSIVSTRPESRPPSTTRSNSMPINSNMSTPVVGSKRYSMSNLPSAAGKRTSMQDIPLGGPSSAIPSDIPDVYAIKRASGPPVHHNRMEALREDSVVGESPLPTPAFPPYSSTRPEADFVEALSQSPAPQQLLLPDRPAIIAAGAQYGNAGSGLLVHVSLVKPPAEIARPGSPKAPRSQAMAHTFSAASATSAMSTSAHQSHPRITLLEPFQIEVFVINRTASEKRLQVGVPTRKALPAQRRQHLASSRAGEILASIPLDCAYAESGNSVEAERSEDSGVVPLDNHAQIGYAQLCAVPPHELM